MNLRRRVLLLAAALVLGSCVDGAADTAPADTAPDMAPVESAESADESVEAEPAVPPLHPVIDDWDESTVTIRRSGGDEVVVATKVAATDEQRRRGLMEVEELPDGVGMLFLFDESRTGGFWMRNTLVPLDIAYVDAGGTIRSIRAMDPCQSDEASDCPTYAPDTPYVTALEVPQGWFTRTGIAEGDTLDWTLTDT